MLASFVILGLIFLIAIGYWVFKGLYDLNEVLTDLDQNERDNYANNKPPRLSDDVEQKKKEKQLTDQ